MIAVKKHTIEQLLCLFSAALCILYGIAVCTVGSGTKFFMIWIGLGLLFLLLGAAIRFRLLERIPKLPARLIRGTAILGLLVFIVIESAIGSHFHDAGEEKLDYIIVLGAQVREDGPSIVLKARLDKAIEYLTGNPDTICIVTGAQGYNEPCPEAECMAEYLIQNGISEERIIRETEAANTVQNIKNSSVFFDSETNSVGIVTNNFHVYRALSIAKKQGIAQVCGIAARSRAFYLPNNCLREFLGVLKDMVQGNM